MVRTMGWKAAYTVRMSGLKGKTKTDVLEALAAMLNEKTGDCFPSTETIARVARVSPNFVRPTLKELEAEGLIQTIQKPGCVRYFRLLLDKLPEPLLKTEGVKEAEPLTKPLPLTKSKGVAEPLGDSSRNREYPPNETVRPPLTKPLPEQGKEQVREQGNEQVVVSPAFADSPPPPTEDDLAAMQGGLFVVEEQRSVKPTSPAEEEAPKPKKRTRRAKPRVPVPFGPYDAIPSDWLTEFSERFPTLDICQEFSKFVNNAISKDVRNAEWKAAFRNWLTNSLTYENQKKGNRYESDSRPVQGPRRFAADSYLGNDGRRPDYGYGIDENFRPIRMPG